MGSILVSQLCMGYGYSWDLGSGSGVEVQVEVPCDRPHDLL